jgi:isoquinoline 1-oxidoreductase beta subunit
MPKTAREYDIAGSATGWKYKFPYNKVSGTVVNAPVLISWLRAVYGTQNPFAIESFIDELAFAAGKDPLELRKDLLVEDSRLKNVMMVAAEKADWNKKLEKGKGRGIAIYEGYNSFCALVAEVTVKGNKLTVDRYVAVIDCGIVVNPDTLESQIEGSIAFALSAALKQKITIKNGAVEQSNYDDFPMLTLSEMPKVEVHIIPSEEKVGGIGELAIAPVAPALCNAIFNASGKRVRKLPIELS